MEFKKFNGIVIKEINTNEADKIITLLTDKKGKISVFAKGARRNRSHISLCTQFLCYSTFIVFKSKDKYYLSSAELIESFYNIREDIIKVIYSSHIMELTSDGSQENQYSNNILRLVLNTLYIINKGGKKELDLIVRVFELKFISLIGFTPNISECCLCGTKSNKNNYFSYKHSGILCNNCLSYDKGAFVVTDSFLKVVAYVINSDVKDIFKFEVSKNLLQELEMIIIKYIGDVMEKRYLKLNLLKEVT